MIRTSAALFGSLLFALGAGAFTTQVISGHPLDRVIAGAIVIQVSWILGMLFAFSREQAWTAWKWLGGLTLAFALGAVFSR